jgi:hypothetical protein
MRPTSGENTATGRGSDGRGLVRRNLLRAIAAVAVLAWLAFVVFGVTGGLVALEAAASSFEAWLYGWSTFPVLLAFSLGAGTLGGALWLWRWWRGRPWLERLAELHEEGVSLRNLGESMTDIASLPGYLRSAAEWEDRTQQVIAERAKVDAVTFKAPPSMLHPELRPRYLSDAHRMCLETHAERVRRLGNLIERRAAI